MATPLMLLGNNDKLHVRVDIDENDAWRFAKGAAGRVRARQLELETKLRFVRTSRTSCRRSAHGNEQ